jgi:hypothetical protein
MEIPKEVELAMDSLQLNIDPQQTKYHVGCKFGYPGINTNKKATWILCIHSDEDKSNLPTEWKGFIVEHRSIPKAL